MQTFTSFKENYVYAGSYCFMLLILAYLFIFLGIFSSLHLS